MRQDQKQLNFWLCPGCAADAREKEKRQLLDKRAVSANTTPVKPSAAVKLPENSEQEEEDEDNDIANAEEGGMEGEEVGTQDKVDKPREGGGSGSGRNSEISIATGREKGAQGIPDAGGSGGGGAADGGPKAEGNKSPKEDLPTWKGLRGMGNNSLQDGTGVGGEGARGSEEQKQGRPEQRGDKDAEAGAASIASVSPRLDEVKRIGPSGVTEL